MEQRSLAQLPTSAEGGVELLCKFFWGLADGTRLQIVTLLLDGEKNVGSWSWLWACRKLGSPTTWRVSSGVGM